VSQWLVDKNLPTERVCLGTGGRLRFMLSSKHYLPT